MGSYCDRCYLIGKSMKPFLHYDLCDECIHDVSTLIQTDFDKFPKKNKIGGN